MIFLSPVSKFIFRINQISDLTFYQLFSLFNQLQQILLVYVSYQYQVDQSTILSEGDISRKINCLQVTRKAAGSGLI